MTDATPEIQAVTDFLSALEALDIDHAMSHTAPDITYQNVPLPPAKGQPAVERTIRAMTRYGTGFEAHIHNIASNGPTVLTERTDVLIIGPWKAKFWVCGTFEVHDGKITLWRDYFDWTTILASSAKGLADVLFTRLKR